MSEIIINDRKTQALDLHEEIATGSQFIAISLIKLGKNLKTMRDSKLYNELGYETFESYTKEKAKIGQRQAYSFIAVYENYGTEKLEKYSSLGITKLYDLIQISAVDRDAFIEEHNITSDTKTRELKELIEKNTIQAEQISLLQTEVKELSKEDVEKAETEKKLDKLKKDKEQLQNKIKELENKPETVTFIEPTIEDLEKIKAELAVDFNQKAEKEKLQAIEDAKAEIEQKYIDERTKKDAEDLKRAEKLAKEQGFSNNVKIAKTNIYFAQFQDAFDNIKSEISEMNEDEKAITIKSMIKCTNGFILELEEIFEVF